MLLVGDDGGEVVVGVVVNKPFGLGVVELGEDF